MAARTTSNKSASEATASHEAATPREAVQPQEASATEAKSAAATKPIVAKEIDPHQYITVRNGFQGRLVYKSAKTGERFVWDNFGDEQEIELLELRNAKNSAKKFFENNWFMFDEDWVVDYLGLKQYYKHSIKIEDFDKIFKMSPTEIKKVVGELSKGQKKSVAYRAKVLIAEGEIDSNKAIAALEESLGIELIER